MTIDRIRTGRRVEVTVIGVHRTADDRVRGRRGRPPDTAVGGASLTAGATLFDTWSLMRSGRETMRLLVTALNVGVATVVSVFAIWIYSVELYPVIPAAFGGGQRAPVTVWIGRSDLPLDALRTLASGRCIEGAEVIRCDGLLLVHRTSDDVLVADADALGLSAMLIPRSAIKAVSWQDANGQACER